MYVRRHEVSRIMFKDVFRRMRDQYIKSGDGFILVYSIADRGSSHSMTAFHEQIIAAKGEKDKIIPQIPIILVGNKVRFPFLVV